MFRSLHKIVSNIFTIFLCLVLTSCQKELKLENMQEIYQSVQGEQLDFSAHKNKWLVINYWATWCAPCRDEIKEINKLVDTKTNNQVLVLGVTLEPIQDIALLGALQKLDIHYSVLRQDIINEWLGIETEAFPSTYIINPDGRLVKSFLGPIKYTDLVKELKLEQVV